MTITFEHIFIGILGILILIVMFILIIKIDKIRHLLELHLAKDDMFYTILKKNAHVLKDEDFKIIEPWNCPICKHLNEVNSNRCKQCGHVPE